MVGWQISRNKCLMWNEMRVLLIWLCVQMDYLHHNNIFGFLVSRQVFDKRKFIKLMIIYIIN
jgi:hypothetical protein